MKIVIALFAILLAGCAGAPIQPLTPAQIVAQINTQVCPSVKLILADLQTPGLVTDPALLAKLPTVQNDVTAVCADGATLNAASLQTLATSALPIVLDVVKAVPGPQQDAAIAGITAAQILLPILIAQVQALPAVK